MLARLFDPCLAIFRGIFIIFQIYRTKLIWNNFCFMALCASIFADLDKNMNRKYFVYKKTYFDVRKKNILKVKRIH
jgi:hypothetical protein